MNSAKRNGRGINAKTVLLSAGLSVACAGGARAQVCVHNQVLPPEAMAELAKREPFPGARYAMARDVAIRMSSSAACFVANPTPEQWANIMDQFGALPPGYIPPVADGPNPDGVNAQFESQSNVWRNGTTLALSIGSANTATPAALTFSFPADGATWGLSQVFPTSANQLNANLTALFGATNLDLGREYIRQAFASWRRASSLTYTEVADNNETQNQSTSPTTTRGDIRVGANAFAATSSGVLAYNAFPSVSGGPSGGDMCINSNWFIASAFADATNSYRYFRNVVSHEHGHGLGALHTVPCDNTKLMEPFAATNFDMVQLDDMRGAQRNYGDRFAGNTTAANARDFGDLTVPSVRSVIERDLSTNGRTSLTPTVSNPNGVDWFKFTLSSQQTVTITATPMGGSYLEGGQVSSCSGTTATVNAAQAGDLQLALLSSTGGTVLFTSSSGGPGVAESITQTLDPGTYTVRVHDGAASNSAANEVLQLYDLVIRVGTSKAPPQVIAGVNKRVAANTTCYFIGDLNSRVTESGATIAFNQWRWDYDGDGTVDTSIARPTFSYVSNGVYPVTLTVTDSNGKAASDTINVTVTGATTGVTGNTPSTGLQGATVPITITGTNFKTVTSASAVTVSGTGVSVIGTPVSNARGTQLTGLSLVIDPAAPTGTRTISVTNGNTGTGGSFTINAGATCPTFSTNPQPQSACSGASVTFTAAASGSPTPTYQWRRNTVDIPGATGPSLTITAGPTTGGTYDVVATNTCGSVPSTGALLTVNAGPSISNQPTPAVVCLGQPAGFSVNASGTGTVTYQWRLNGNPVGTNSPSLSIPAAAGGDAGSYDCVITDSCSSITSNAVSLTVNTGPSISAGPQAFSGCEGQPASFSVNASGSGTLSYQWRLNGQPVGTNSPTLNIPAAGPTDVGTYDCVVTDSCSSLTSSGATLSLSPLPTFSVQPVDAAAYDGQNATVFASVSGATSLQWKKGANPVPGATSAVLSLSPATLGDAGTYTLVATNACGDVSSTTITLSVYCGADYNGDGQINLDDLGDFITDYYTTPTIPGGAQPDAPTYAGLTIGYGVICPDAPDAPPPYALDAYRRFGYRTGISPDGSNACGAFGPNLDNLGDYITTYYAAASGPCP
jgi:hypothetical protein